MRVIGTAGHVDHGKSTLVAALTGMHPDRLKEEQEREMTIDLGFAWLTLPGGEPVGIVDVPGHRDFIENMLAGIGGIDAVVFVVAADEGVMPQTREHLAILDLLQVQAGIIALTKTDLAPDPDWLDLVEMDLRAVLTGTVLENAPLVRVSAKTGAGLPLLLQVLAECLSAQPERLDLGRARLPVDRVFTMPGFGTVVTGTLLDGRLAAGETVEILPLGLQGRVRGLQMHRRKQQSAEPGSRTAVNVSGIDVKDLRRGDVLVKPGAYLPTRRLDVRFRLLPDASLPLKHSSESKFFLGTAEIPARVRLLGVEELLPGQEGWLQLELNDPTVAVRGDRFILRRPSPAETIGGGVVIDPHPKGRHRRFSTEVLQGLDALRKGAPADVLLQVFGAGALSLRAAVQRARLPEEDLEQALKDLVQQGALVLLEPGEPLPGADLLALPAAAWQDWSARTVEILQQFHAQRPLLQGMAKAELRSRMKMSTPRLVQACLSRWKEEGLLEENANLVWRTGHVVRFTQAQQTRIDAVMARFAAAPYTPPSLKEVIAELGEDVASALMASGQLTQVADDVVFRPQDYEQIVDAIRAHFAQESTLTAAQLRDRLSTSRKYALAVLEHLDSAGVTERVGDARILRRNANRNR